MSIVSISVDTISRQTTLAVNGVLIPVTEFCVEKYLIEGQETVRVSYVIDVINSDGIKERRQFYLSSLEELATQAHGGLNEDNFSSRYVYDDKKAKADVIDFLRHNRERS